MSILCFCLDTYLPTSSFVWSPASESALFQALIKHKPAGGRWTSLVLVFKKCIFKPARYQQTFRHGPGVRETLQSAQHRSDQQ